MKIAFHLPKLPLSREQIIGPVSVFLVALLCLINSDMWSTTANFDREAIVSGEYWRVITGHFFHTNTMHFLLNCSGIIMLWLLHGHYYTTRSYLALIVILCITTSLFIYLFSPKLHLYVGLSGVLHGIFVYGAIKDILHNEKTGYILLLGLTLKVLHEQIVGPSADISALIDADVAIDAHLWGALSGAIYTLLHIIILKWRPS